MTFMTMPKKLQKDRRVDSAHSVEPSHAGKPTVAELKRAAVEAAVEAAADQEIDPEENVPVIRANHILFSSGRTGRTRVVFY